jgi:hypothetical protein
MTPEERQLREDLGVLASSQQGRRLLQLGLRGIKRGEHGVTAGCWTVHGNAGCLFQHAYWEGVREGVFADHGRPGDWIGSFVGSHDYGIVIRVIDAFDRLARAAYADREPRAFLPRRIRIRQSEWNAAVAHLLVSVLGETQAGETSRTSIRETASV